jgi:hypothetical protein
MTAVEWLDKQITICFENYSGTTLYHRIEDKIEQAKEMEKQQIENAFEAGFVTQKWDKTKENKAEQYFKEKFNK